MGKRCRCSWEGRSRNLLRRRPSRSQPNRKRLPASPEQSCLRRRVPFRPQRWVARRQVRRRHRLPREVQRCRPQARVCLRQAGPSPHCNRLCPCRPRKEVQVRPLRLQTPRRVLLYSLLRSQLSRRPPLRQAVLRKSFRSLSQARGRPRRRQLRRHP